MVEPEGRLHEASVLEHKEDDDGEASEPELGREVQRAVDDEVRTLSHAHYLPGEVRSGAGTEDGVCVEDIPGCAGLCLAILVAGIGRGTCALQDRDPLADHRRR